MATSLTGQNVNSTYDSLLKVGDNNTVTSTLKQVSDGLGNEFPMQISSTQVIITGSLSGSATTATSASFATNATSASYAATASVAQQLSATDIATNGNYKLLFKSGAATIETAHTDAGVVYNPSTNRLTVDGVISASSDLFAGSVTAAGGVGGTAGIFTSYVQTTNVITTNLTASIISASSGITGSLFGTASWATNAVTANFATTATNAINATNADNIDVTATTTTSEIIPVFTAVAGTNVALLADSSGISYIPSNNTLKLSGSFIQTGSQFISGGVATQYIDFDKTAAPAFAEGRVNWIDDTKTLAIDTDVNGIQIEVGHQTVVRARNENAFTILKSRVVYMSGSSGNRPLIYTASWESDAVSAGTLGLAAADIAQNNNGYVISSGIIRDVNTSAFTAGTPLYLSSSGQITSTVPVAPLHTVRLGKVVTSHATTGIIYVDIDNGYEIGELHDVVDNSTDSTYGELLVKSGSVWKNSRQLTGSYGLTGSLSATSFTGSLHGTASWALNVVGGGGGGGVTINNNVDNYLVTATGTANTLNGESGLQFDGTTLTVVNNAVIGAIDVRNDPATTIGDWAEGAHMARDWAAAGGPALTAGNIVYFSGSQQWANAQANATGSSTRVLGVVTNNAVDSEIVLQGTVTVNTDLATYQIGQPVYLSPLTAGRVTNVPPSSSGHVARYVGWVVDNNRDQIYFNPDFTYIQL